MVAGPGSSRVQSCGPTAISSPRLAPRRNSSRSPLQNLPGSYQFCGRCAGQQAHRLIGHGDQFCAVDRLGRPVVAQPTGQPALRQAAGRRERFAVQPGDRRQDLVLHLLGHVEVQLPQPGPGVVALVPERDRIVQVVQLHPALPLAGPHVRQRPAQFGVPQQRRQVVQHHGHPDVIDRRVGQGLDGPIRRGRPAEQPDVPGAGELDGAASRVEADCRVGCRGIRLGYRHAGVEMDRCGRGGRRRGDRRRGRPQRTAATRLHPG